MMMTMMSSFLVLVRLITVLLICCVKSAASTGSTKVPSSVLELNDRFLEVKHEGHWFVEFYAPWCGHCKRLNPIWEQLGHALSETEIRVARLDCTRFTKVSSEVGITGFPTLKYYRNGIEFTYEGDRSKDALLDFALKVYGPEVREIENKEKFQQTNNRHFKTGFFVLVSQGEASELAKDFHSVAKEMFTKAYFFSLKAEDLPSNISVDANSEEVLCIKDGSYTQFDPANDEKQKLKDWVNDQRWPVFGQITYGSLYDMGLCCDKLLVIVVSDIVKRKKQDSDVYKFSALVEKMANKYRKELGKKFFFVWTDGPEMPDNIIMGSMKTPGLLVFNASSYQFFLPEDPPSQITEGSLKLFLDTIAKGGKLPLGGRGFFQRLKRIFFEIYSAIYGMFATQPLLSCCLFGLPLGIVSIICYTLCSADVSVDQEEIYKDSDEDSEMEDHEKRE